jgi:hypothetical protein
MQFTAKIKSLGMRKVLAIAVLLCGMAMQSWSAVNAVTAYYPGTDATNPWGLKLERDFSGKLATYEYAWSGANFVTAVKTGGGDNPGSTTVPPNAPSRPWFWR